MNNSASKSIHVRWLLLGGIGLCVLSFSLRLYSLNQTAYANGWDSYFYLVQLKSVVEEGKMHSEEWTLLYPLLVVFHYISPDDVTAVKLFSACLAGCFTLLMLLNARALKLDAVPVLLVGALTLWSPELTYFTAQWPKNLLGLNLLLLLLLCIQYDKRGWIFFLLVIGFFGHRMTAVLSVVLVGVWLAMRHLTRTMISVAILSAGMMVLAGWIFKGVLNIHDLDRLKQFISFEPQLPIVSFFAIFGADKISFLWKSELILVLVSFLVVCASLIDQFMKGNSVNPITILVAILFIVLWFPFYHWDLARAGYRFFHVGVLLLPLMFIVLLNYIRIHAKVSDRNCLSFSSFIILLLAYVPARATRSSVCIVRTSYRKYDRFMESKWKAGVGYCTQSTC